MPEKTALTDKEIAHFKKLNAWVEFVDEELRAWRKFLKKTDLAAVQRQFPAPPPGGGGEEINPPNPPRPFPPQ